MFVLLSCFLLYSTNVGALAEDRQACIDGMCEMEEGLEMLQARAATIKPHADKEEVKEVKEDHMKPTRELKKAEFEFEKTLLQDSDFQMVRFRARNKDWTDIVDLYNDGYFKRYHGEDRGTWQVKNGVLTLKWLRWGDDVMTSKDGGQSFSTSGDKAFTLKSYSQPAWFSHRFSPDYDSKYDELSKMSRSAILANHVDGKSVPLDEEGYVSVAETRDNVAMTDFIRRVVDKMGLKVRDEGGFSGMVQFFSGIVSQQSYQKLEAELTRTAEEDKVSQKWVMYPDRSPVKAGASPEKIEKTHDDDHEKKSAVKNEENKKQEEESMDTDEESDEEDGEDEEDVDAALLQEGSSTEVEEESMGTEQGGDEEHESDEDPAFLQEDEEHEEDGAEDEEESMGAEEESEEEESDEDPAFLQEAASTEEEEAAMDTDEESVEEDSKFEHPALSFLQEDASTEEHDGNVEEEGDDEHEENSDEEHEEDSAEEHEEESIAEDDESDNNDAEENDEEHEEDTSDEDEEEGSDEHAEEGNEHDEEGSDELAEEGEENDQKDDEERLLSPY